MTVIGTGGAPLRVSHDLLRLVHIEATSVQFSRRYVKWPLNKS